MFAEKAERIEHRAHLLGDGAQRAADDLELDVDHSSASATSVPSPRPVSPAQPGRDPAVAPSSSSDAPGRRRASGSAAGSASARARARPRRSARRRARSAARDRRSRSAPRARGGTRSARSGAERHRQLERLAAVAQVGLARRRAARRASASGHDVRAHAVAPLVARDEPERREDAGGGRDEHRVDPSSSASAHACSGPAPPNATSAKSRGSWPRSTETTRSARTISALTTSITAAGSMPPSARARPRRGRARSRPAARAGSRPSRRLASVTVGSAAAAAVAGGPGIGAGALRADAQRAARVEPDDRAAARRRPCARRPSAAGREAADDPLARSRSRSPAGDQADVGRRAAHVERDRVLEARRARRRAPRRRRPPAGPERRRAPHAPPPPRASRRRPTSA